MFYATITRFLITNKKECYVCSNLLTIINDRINPLPSSLSIWTFPGGLNALYKLLLSRLRVPVLVVLTLRTFFSLILKPNMKKIFSSCFGWIFKEKIHLHCLYSWMQIAIYSLILVKRSKCLIEIHTCTMHIVHILKMFFFYMQWSLIDRKCELK